MKDFLRQNWLWLIVPLALMAVAIFALTQMGGGSGDGGYQIF